MGARWEDPVPPADRPAVTLLVARVWASFVALPVGWQAVIVGLAVALAVVSSVRAGT